MNDSTERLVSPPPCQKLNVYCQSSGVLLQFILSEFLAAYPEVRAMGGLHAELDSQLSHTRLHDSTLSCLANALANLTGGVIEETHPLPWTRNQGALGKLKHYCQHYQNPDPSLAVLIADLKTASSKCFHAVLLARELVRQIRNGVEDDRRLTDLGNLSRMLKRLANNMNQFAQYIAAILPQHHRDESILLFLLRHRKAFDDLYQPYCLIHHLTSSYPEGLHSVSAYLSQQYQARGFDHILPAIQRLVETAAQPIVP